MKCQSCGKKEAAIRYKENINGKKQEINLCYECAQNLGFVQFSNIFSPMFMNIPNYLLKDKNICETCGYSFEDYTNTGLLGCADCYDAFKTELDDILYKIHGKNRHVKINDKILKKAKLNNKDTINELDELKSKLKEYIEKEEYENAANIRDKIKVLEGKV